MKIIRVLIIVNQNTSDLGRSFYMAVNRGRKWLDGIDFQIQFKEVSDPELQLYLSDVLVVFDGQTIFSLRDKVSYMQPMVYVCDSSDDSTFPPDMVFLDRFIIIDKNIHQTMFWGIPKELISNIPLELTLLDTFLKADTVVSNEFRVRYDVGDEALSTVKKIIKIFNGSPTLHLDIFTSEQNVSVLEGICNDNIRCFKHLSQSIAVFSDYGLYIGSGRRIIHAVRTGIPSFVLGSHGLGGLVTAENFADYYRVGFKGRIGGVQGEEVPMRLLDILFKDALDEIARYHARSAKLINPKEIEFIIGVDNKFGITEILNVFADVVEIKKVVGERQKFPNLYAQVFRHVNVSIFEKEGSEQLYYLTNRETGKFIGALDEDEYEIFLKCASSMRVKQIFEATEKFEPDEIYDFLIELWQNRIINFRL